jgi:NADH-quinone oxidoreductase subunit N
LLFVEGYNHGLGWLVLVAALNSVVSLFYYFRVAKALFLADESARAAAPQPAFVGFLCALGVATLVLGLYVTPLVSWATRSLDILARA